MILEVMCQASETWLKEMEDVGTPVYEYEDEWPVTIEIKGQTPNSIEARVLAKDKDVNIFIIKCDKGYKLQWRDAKGTYAIDELSSFTNDLALQKISSSVNPFDVQSIATAVRKIGETFPDF
ncbi:hypothetical protein [Tepidibacillus fermentans]|uniref:Uncharacterized protein n=1 Tax=Tepidibacillus fermentans TaxID=1281767 RepID=A0A4R3K645_9BACI|nr:hypothetical protein [Tepidibacillus fermentans]TCS78230.1 hypothetical protein EDD72_1297 [Tepidibacillus fermentans]